MRGALAIAVLGVALTTPATAQNLARPNRDQVKQIDRGVIKHSPVHVLKALPIVSNPDGSHVSDIDGKRRNFGFKPGSIHSIRGKGFGRKSGASTVLLKSADGRYAVNLSISRWDDDLIIAQVPPGQSGLPSADQLNLMILTGPSNGGPRQFVVAGGRYEAEEAEARITLTAADQRALTDAGLRIKAWNRGREFFTAERDGSITVTHYIDFPKDQRTQHCPGPGSDRINLTQLATSLRLRPGFRISRVAMTNGPTDGHFTGRYANTWQGVDGTMYLTIDWGVWRLRRDATFQIGGAWDVADQPFGKHVIIPPRSKVFTACGSEFTLTFFATGPRGLSPR
jgi:hypothetical protein